VTATMQDTAWDPAGHRAQESRARTSTHHADERRLVARLRAGEAAAVDEFYRAYRKPIFGFLVRLAKNRHVAEDLFQNTWLKVSRSIERLREDTELKAWIFTVARNEFRSYRRWQLVDLSRIFLFGREREEPLHEPAGESNESMALASIDTGLAALGASDREVLLLVCVEGMAPQEAAAVLGVSHAALRQRLGRARARLKDVVTKLETGSGQDQRCRARNP
jgi:RNA polymerase sigma-70 factor, ECF subfamily